MTPVRASERAALGGRLDTGGDGIPAVPVLALAVAPAKGTKKQLLCPSPLPSPQEQYTLSVPASHYRVQLSRPRRGDADKPRGAEELAPNSYLLRDNPQRVTGDT